MNFLALFWSSDMKTLGATTIEKKYKTSNKKWDEKINYL